MVHKVRWLTLYIQMITSHQTLFLMLSWSIFHVTQGHLSYKRTLNLYHLCPFQDKLSADATTASKHRYYWDLDGQQQHTGARAKRLGKGQASRYIIINPGTRSFESWNPGALFVALSRAKSSGIGFKDPDFAFNSSLIINEGRLCHKVCTNKTKATQKEILSLNNLAVQIKQKFHSLLKKQYVCKLYQ